MPPYVETYGDELPLFQQDALEERNSGTSSISRSRLPLYFGSGHVVHDARPRGKTLLSALVAALAM